MENTVLVRISLLDCVNCEQLEHVSSDELRVTSLNFSLRHLVIHLNGLPAGVVNSPTSPAIYFRFITNIRHVIQSDDCGIDHLTDFL